MNPLKWIKQYYEKRKLSRVAQQYMDMKQDIFSLAQKKAKEPDDIPDYTIRMRGR